MQTNLFKARKGKAQGTENRRDFADKLCLQMQTKGCAFCRQGSSKNADKFCRRIFSRHFPPECRQTSSKMKTRALNFSRNCRQIMQTKFVYPPDGDACILGCLQGFVYRVCLHFRQIMQTKFVYGVLQSCLRKCRQRLSTYMKSLSVFLDNH